MALHRGTHQPNYLALHLRRTQMNKALSSVNIQWPVGSSSAWLLVFHMKKTYDLSNIHNRNLKTYKLGILTEILVIFECLTP